MLSALLGGQHQSSLGQVVAKFAGVNQGAAGSLLGMLAPVVLGTIGQQRQQGRSLDASGITDLLASQKDNIAAALPSGFSNLLGGTGLLDALGDAALLIYFFGRQAEQVVQQGVPPAQSLMVGGLDLGKQVTDSIAGLRTTLNGVTDTASAEAALPKLRDVTAQIDKVDGMIGQLSSEQRKLLAGLVNPAMPALNQLFDRVLAIPGVAGLLKPAIDTLKAKLEALAA